MAKNNLADFLKKLAQDPGLMERYRANPRGVMTDAGVDPAHQELIIKGDTDALQRELNGNPDAIPITSIRSFK